ncbi:MAG: hypothetical protein A3F72_01755 [Bacteroidetes bacterium RIFCSPLOWO2_12_FULL_35_15]|nr:MAG: hypothetical protein A3F72_01755 [Bacteroidetes bacterium RIFCSPLOWO2_12_FULL_35_15]
MFCQRTEQYRYGFNGQEKDDEISGSGNMNTAMFWEYDTRLGRRWNVDPVPDASVSSYATFLNNPVFHTDVDGDEVGYEKRRDRREARREARRNPVFKAQLEDQKSQTDKTFLYGRRDNEPTIDAAVPNSRSSNQADDGTEIMNVLYSKPGLGGAQPINWQTTETIAPTNEYYNYKTSLFKRSTERFEVLPGATIELDHHPVADRTRIFQNGNNIYTFAGTGNPPGNVPGTGILIPANYATGSAKIRVTVTSGPLGNSNDTRYNYQIRSPGQTTVIRHTLSFNGYNKTVMSVTPIPTPRTRTN